MIELHDSFNGCLISKHRTLRNAILAKKKYEKAIQERHGQNSYLTFAFRQNGKWISEDDVQTEEYRLDSGW